ncbi:hypothetical protein [Desulfurobacterium indicum]|uniref:Uncharacterized protein n=1 Tax=Desulfurobacterium indicum TaxID=1914305 RepID=A0A1R1MJL4_9BACT|nr:hypothetical protein [Desulfurobacterium indicum]OMH40008.1 hypothetical protein BLW93_07495 [Desulfurobacterium indicum]
MDPLIVTINRAYRKGLTEEKLAKLIKEQIFPKSYPLNEQVEVFFSEVPVPMVVSFCEKHEIDMKELKKYYDRYIKSKFRNEELEELWNIF